MFEIRVSEPGDIEQLLARAAREYRHAARLTFRVSPFTSPLFEARLALEGHEREEALVMLLDGPLRRATTRFDIRPIEDDAAWRAYTELQCLDWSEQALPLRRYDPQLGFKRFGGSSVQKVRFRRCWREQDLLNPLNPRTH